MLTSISPLGEQARNQRWSHTVAAYGAASIFAGASLGAALGGAGQLSGVPLAVSALIVAIAVVVVASEAGWLVLPGPRRQVNEDWLGRYRGWVYGAGYGAQLGVGVVTVVGSAAVYLTLGLEFAVGSWRGGALIGSVFGLVRSLPVFSVWGASDFDGLAHRHRRLLRLREPVRRLCIVALCAVAAGLAVSVLGRPR